jgi:hypothetical protein
MAWVRFTRNFDWKPTRQVTIAYKAGSTLNVKSACADRAVSAGAAVRVKKTGKYSEPVELPVVE